jgi:hypothetical protein
MLVMPLLGLLYVAVLIRNLHESERRSLQLREVRVGDYVSVGMKVVEVDVNRSEVRVQLQLRPVGNLALDGVTPTRNLKLFLNASRGSQEIDFPSGERMNPLEADFFIDGDTNRYPFDRYQTTLWLLVTTPSRHDRSPAAVTPARSVPPISDLAVGAAASEQNDVPISIDLRASIPGVKFSGKISRAEGCDVTGVDLYMRRADSVIGVSIAAMLIMMCLALSLLGTVLRATAVEKPSTLFPLSLSVSLIFGLPALRNNLQPSVPPVGVFSDYVSFFWAELIVAASTVVFAWSWIMKSEDRK